MTLVKNPTTFADYVTDGYVRGWSFTPLSGKRPTLSGWQSRPRPSLAEVQQWAAENKNIGLRTGQGSGVIVIDEDRDKGGDVTNLALPSTGAVVTGGGGRHYYFEYHLPLGNSAGRLGAHIDVRGDGGQVVYPGSVHPDTGVVYEWLPGHAPWETKLANLPAEIVDKLRTKTKRERRPVLKELTNDFEPTQPAMRDDRRLAAYGRMAVKLQLNELRGAGNGSRNSMLNESAFSLGTLIPQCLSRLAVEDELRHVATEIGLEPGEIEATITSGLDAGEREPRTIDLGERPYADHDAIRNQRDEFTTDLGNSRRFTRQMTGRAMFCGAQGRWYLWSGTHWKQDEDCAVLNLAKQVALSIFDEAKAASLPERQEYLGKWAVKSQARARLEAMVFLAGPDLAIGVEDLDQDAWLFNCVSGTVDLRTGNLRKHDSANRITKISSTRYDAKAACPRWTQFLQEIMNCNDKLITYLQRVFGYCLTGDVSEQYLWLMHGSGSNGKSVFTDILSSVMGDYASEAAPDLLLASQGERHPTGEADLFGRRLVIASETEDSRRLNTALTKRLTGNAKVKARYMRGDFFEFERTFKLFLVTNCLPTVHENSVAVWRRLRAVPFAVQIAPGRQDKTLLTKLKAEQSGVLNWLIRGCLDWQKHGLSEPDEVSNATQAYQMHEDTLADFFEQHCQFDPREMVSRGELYMAYVGWTEQKKDKYPLRDKRFFDEVRRRTGIGECQPRVNGQRDRFFTGIGLINDGKNKTLAQVEHLGTPDSVLPAKHYTLQN